MTLKLVEKIPNPSNEEVIRILEEALEIAKEDGVQNVFIALGAVDSNRTLYGGKYDTYEMLGRLDRMKRLLHQDLDAIAEKIR